MIQASVSITVDLPPIFDPAQLQSAIRAVVYKTSKEFAEHIRVSMVNSKPRGRKYREKSGPGFKRFHKASRKGQRPAIWTTNLINAIDQKMTGWNSALVDFKPTPNPRNKVPADVYAEKLENNLGRIVHGKGDVRKFNSRQRQLLIQMRDRLVI